MKQDVPNIDGDMMAYADNMACWSLNEKPLKEVVVSFDRKLKGVGLKINVEKTEILMVRSE